MTLADWAFQGIGMLGVTLALYAYFMLQAGKISGDSVRFPLLNLIAATFVAVSLLWQWNFAAFMLEAAWMLISMYGIARQLGLANKSTMLACKWPFSALPLLTYLGHTLRCGSRKRHFRLSLANLLARPGKKS